VTTKYLFLNINFKAYLTTKTKKNLKNYFFLISYYSLLLLYFLFRVILNLFAVAKLVENILGRHLKLREALTYLSQSIT
jgi:hypothetical protein